MYDGESSGYTYYYFNFLDVIQHAIRECDKSEIFNNSHYIEQQYYIYI